MRLGRDISNLSSLVSPAARRRLKRLALAQSASAVLDVVGVVLLGAAVVSLTSSPDRAER